MRYRRSLRAWLASWLILIVFSTQLATAAYACPMADSRAAAIDAAAMSGMPCAGEMVAGAALDPDQPGLCLQHCQFGKTQVPSDSAQPLPAAADLGVPLALNPQVAPGPAITTYARHERSRERAPPESHSLLHCCYRI